MAKGFTKVTTSPKQMVGLPKKKNAVATPRTKNPKPPKNTRMYRKSTLPDPNDFSEFGFGDTATDGRN